LCQSDAQPHGNADSRRTQRHTSQSSSPHLGLEQMLLELVSGQWLAFPQRVTGVKTCQIHIYNNVQCRRLCPYKRVCQACKNSICVAIASASCQPPTLELPCSPSYRYPSCLYQLFYNAMDLQLATCPPAMPQQMVCCVVAGFGRQ